MSKISGANFRHEELLNRITDDTHFPSDIGSSLRAEARALCQLGDIELKAEAKRLQDVQSIQQDLARADFASGQKSQSFSLVEQASGTAVLRQIAEAEMSSRGILQY